MKSIIALLFAVSLCGCSKYPIETTAIENPKPELIHTTVPDGYKIICDGYGHYLFKMHGGNIVGRDIENTPFDSYSDALQSAWKQYEFGVMERDREKWSECSK